MMGVEQNKVKLTADSIVFFLTINKKEQRTETNFVKLVPDAVVVVVVSLRSIC